MAERKIYTLEECLQMFQMEHLLKKLDESLKRVRRNKLKEEDHLEVFKSVDKILRNLSLIHHPDKATSEKKSDREIAKAKNRQIALNATRKVLQGLTKVFIEDIDIHYSYELFAKMDVSTLINEKEMDRQINNVLCKISLLSEVKRVNIVGEIRKFLQESRKSLERFQERDKDEFERYRDYALHHLYNCIEGYNVLVSECELIVKELGGEHGESASCTIEKILNQSKREQNILQNLGRVAKKSLDGMLRIFTIHESEDSYDYYHVSPFVLYTNVMLMCTTAINGKLGICTKVKNYFKSNTNPTFNIKPELFLKAYYFASYFCSKTQFEGEVEIMLQKNRLTTSIDNIIKVFKDTVKSIGEFLAKEFDLTFYKEGKSNREIFIEKLSKLNESLVGCKKIEKELQENLDQCKKETSEIRKEFFEFSEKVQETEVQCLQNILKSKNTCKETDKLMCGCYEIKGARDKNLYEANASENVNFYDAEEDSAETKLTKRIDQYEKSAKSLLEFLIKCRPNVSKFEGQASIANQSEYTPVITGEIGKKIKGSFEVNKMISEHLNRLMVQNPTETSNDITGKNLEDSLLKKSNDSNTI